jgi:hypothetical protein
MKRNWIRNLIKGLSFTSVLFAFQACYGSPQDFENDVLIQGQVKSLTTHLPIEGIKVSADQFQYQLTDTDGRFYFYIQEADSYRIRFDDIDESIHGEFYSRDTVLAAIDDNTYLEIVMEER